MFAPKCFFTQQYLHPSVFWKSNDYTKVLSHTTMFAPKCFLTQQCLHLNAFSHKDVCTLVFSHTTMFAPKCFLKQQWLHLSAFSHNNVCTLVLFHTTKCNQDQMLTTTSPPFKLIHTVIDAYMYILHLLTITQFVSIGLQMIHFWIRSSQWTQTFSKCLCACF